MWFQFFVHNFKCSVIAKKSGTAALECHHRKKPLKTQTKQISNETVHLIPTTNSRKNKNVNLCTCGFFPKIAFGWLSVTFFERLSPETCWHLNVPFVFQHTGFKICPKDRCVNRTLLQFQCTLLFQSRRTVVKSENRPSITFTLRVFFIYIYILRRT